jgi:hypothetical protein
VNDVQVSQFGLITYARIVPHSTRPPDLKTIINDLPSGLRSIFSCPAFEAETSALRRWYPEIVMAVEIRISVRIRKIVSVFIMLHLVFFLLLSKG